MDVKYLGQRTAVGTTTLFSRYGGLDLGWFGFDCFLLIVFDSVQLDWVVRSDWLVLCWFDLDCMYVELVFSVCCVFLVSVCFGTTCIIDFFLWSCRTKNNANG